MPLATDFLLNRSGNADLSVVQTVGMSLGPSISAGDLTLWFLEMAGGGAEGSTALNWLAALPGFPTSKFLLSWRQYFDGTGFAPFRLFNPPLLPGLFTGDPDAGTLFQFQPAGYAVGDPDAEDRLNFVLNDANPATLTAAFQFKPLTRALSHILVLVDTEAGTMQLAYDGALQTAELISVDGPIVCPAGPYQMTGGDTGAGALNSYVADFWWDAAPEIDSLTDDVIAKFYSGGGIVDLGADGSLPLGRPPSAYHSIRSGGIPGVPLDPATINFSGTVTPHAGGTRFRMTTVDFIDGPYQPQFNRITTT